MELCSGDVRLSIPIRTRRPFPIDEIVCPSTISSAEFPHGKGD
jgi:hypothetical protein